MQIDRSQCGHSRTDTTATGFIATCNPRWTWLRSRVQISTVCVAVVGATSCGSEDAGTRRYDNVGSFCLLPPTDGGATRVLVKFDDDVCGTCAVGVGSCSAIAVEARVELRSSLVLRYQDGECQSACGRFFATCELEGPASGNYGFAFESRFETATVPPETSVALFGHDNGCDVP
jgi:hypothetical protein